MLKKEVTSHFLVVAIWLLVVTVFRWDWGWYLVLFWLGGFFGTVLLDIDQVFYVLIIYPQKEALALFKNKQYRQLISLLVETASDRTNLLCHNAVFQLIFFVFCFWALISTNSWFGKGMVMGMSLHLIKDELDLMYRKKEAFLNRLLFWPLKKSISLKEQKLFVVFVFWIFLALTLLLL